MNGSAIFNYLFEKYGIAVSEKDIEKIKEFASENSSVKINRQKALEIFEFYNVHRNKMPSAKEFSATRESNIKSRIKKYGTDKVKEVILMASDSDFLNGMNGSFTASFDWIIKPANFIKILEGNYQNKTHAAQYNNSGTQHGTSGISKNGGKVDGTSEILSGNFRYIEPT